MGEYYQKVWAVQFQLTDQEKIDILANKIVYWQGEPVKHSGTERFHILLNVGEMPKPIYHGQWLVKKDGQTEILWEHDFKSKYLPAAPVSNPENPKPIQSEALKRFLDKKSPVENPAPEKPKAEPAQTEDKEGKPQAETWKEAPVYDAVPADSIAPIIGQVTLNGQEATTTNE